MHSSVVSNKRKRPEESTPPSQSYSLHSSPSPNSNATELPNVAKKLRLSNGDSKESNIYSHIFEDEQVEGMLKAEQLLIRRQKLIQLWNRITVYLQKLEQLIEKEMDNSNLVLWTQAEYSLLYADFFNLCTSPESNYYEQKLYNLYTFYVTVYLRDRVLPTLQSKDHETMTLAFVSIWKNFKNVFLKFCSKLFTYLNRFFKESSADSLAIEMQGARIFKEVVFDTLKESLRTVILKQLSKDRNGEMIDRSHVRELVSVFSAVEYKPLLHIYQIELERFVEIETEDFYKQLCQNWISQYSLTEYLIHAEAKLKEEQSRLAAIFHSPSQNRLMKLCNEQLLKVRQMELLEMSGSGVEVLIREQKLEDLARLYRLMERIDELQPVATILRDYVTKVGMDIFYKHEQMNRSIKDYNKYIKSLLDAYIDDLLTFHEKMDNMVRESFSNSVVFHKALSEGFKHFVNENFRKNTKGEIQTPQLFAFYCDELLRKKSDKLDEKLDKIVKFIQFFRDKDVFVEEYKKQLAKRLLTSDAVSSEFLEEKNMIAKLKYYYRAIGDIYKLEKMLKDKTIQAECNQSFEEYIKTNKISMPFEMTVSVLTMGTWPITLQETLLPPKEIVLAQETFRQFHDEKYGKKVLKWSYAKSTAQIVATFDTQSKLLEVSTYQAVILILFNDSNILSFSEIKQATNLSEEEVKRLLYSLTNKQIPILKFADSKTDQGTTQDEEDDTQEDKNITEKSFEVNASFTHKLRKIKVPSVRVTEEDTNKTKVTVDEDRNYVLEAAIVRIMKARKTAKLQELIREVLEHVGERFKPDVKQIKQRVESLIERDYMQRSEEDSSVLEYVA